MTKNIVRHAPSAAQNLVGVWYRHRQEVEERPLPYLDDLMEELLAVDRFTPGELAEELASMVPELRLGTARRLVGLKFPGFKQGDLLPQTSHH